MILSKPSFAHLTIIEKLHRLVCLAVGCSRLEGELNITVGKKLK